MSERADIAQRLAEFVSANQLAQIYGGDVSQDQTKKGKPYNVGFSVARYVDGNILIYGPKFINVGYQTAYRDLPSRDQRVFTSIDDAERFLRLAFVELKFQEALDIPVRTK